MNDKDQDGVCDGEQSHVVYNVDQGDSDSDGQLVIITCKIEHSVMSEVVKQNYMM